MSFLNSNNSEFLSARITRRGRQSIAEGNFIIKYFQIGDSEFDYNTKFSAFTGAVSGGTRAPHQRVLSPIDGDQHVKYPYLINTDETINFGNAAQQSYIDTLKNPMGPAGFVSEFIPYVADPCTGSTVECVSGAIPLNRVNGGTGLLTSLMTGATTSDFSNCQYITLVFKSDFVGSENTISGNSQSLVYKIVSINGQTITLDRNMPDFSAQSTGIVRVVCNKCKLDYPQDTEVADVCSPLQPDNLAQHDPWQLELVWTQEPAGLDTTDDDEYISGYTGSQFASLKEYLGYTSNTGQTFTNTTGGTITNPTSYTNTFGEKVDVKPANQRAIAVIHYSELGDIVNNPERFYKYDDYIAHGTIDNETLYGEQISDSEYFEVYIPFLLYHRNTGSTIGAVFTMGTTDYYVSSALNVKPNTNNLKFRFLVDQQGINVGKVFVDKKIIVFDDQELVAALEYKTNRKWTLPAPRFSTVPLDLPTFYDLDPVILTGQTAWVTYMFQNTSTTGITGMHCNYYGEITGSTSSNIGFKFNTGEFKFLSSSSQFTGFTANKFFALVQVTTTGSQPSPNNWKRIELTSQISGHTVGNLISNTNMCGYQFVVTGDMVNGAATYNLESYLGTLPDKTQTTLPQFGDSQPFPGSVKLTRATDVQVLNFMVNLPSSQFITTQNPTYVTGQQKRITEVALLNDNKEPLVMAKCPKPISRIGNQVFSVRLDF
jgi:hypothetical protein